MIGVLQLRHQGAIKVFHIGTAEKAVLREFELNAKSIKSDLVRDNIKGGVVF